MAKTPRTLPPASPMARLLGRGPRGFHCEDRGHFYEILITSLHPRCRASSDNYAEPDYRGHWGSCARFVPESEALEELLIAAGWGESLTGLWTRRRRSRRVSREAG